MHVAPSGYRCSQLAASAPGSSALAAAVRLPTTPALAPTSPAPVGAATTASRCVASGAIVEGTMASGVAVLAAPSLPAVSCVTEALRGGLDTPRFVGQGARPAAEYHEHDFDWDEHAAAVRHIVEAQQAQALALRSLEVQESERSQQQASSCCYRSPQQQQQDQVGGKAPEPQEPLCQGQEPGTRLQGAQGGQTQGLPNRPLTDEGSCSCSSSGGTVAGGPNTRASTRAAGAGERTPHPGRSSHSHHATPHATDGTSTGCWQPRGQPTEQPLQPQTQHGPQQRNLVKELDNNGRIAGPSVAVPTSGQGHQANALIPPPPAAPASSTAAAPDLATSAHVTHGSPYEGSKWEEFYRSHPSARFFKERRYLLLEFPQLLGEGVRHVAEIGCGCGSSILPVLKANPAARTTCTDISTTCLDQLLVAAAAEGIARERLSVFPADSTDPAAAPAFKSINADALLIMFTLSAVPPPQQHVMLSHAWRALAPGGRLMIRDHGLYDMVQLRIPADQWVGPNLYKRGDGTIANFFSCEDLSARAAAAGFRTEECKYVTVVNRNRKSGLELRRVFVHGVFVKPG